MKKLFLIISLYSLPVLAYTKDANSLEQLVNGLKRGPNNTKSSCSSTGVKDKKCKLIPAAFLDGSKLRKFNFKVTLLNDAFPHILGLQPDEILNGKMNDMGLTHGFSFSSAFRSNDGDVFQLKLDKKLFTGLDQRKYDEAVDQEPSPKDDQPPREQVFTEENTYLLTWRHFMKDGEHYFDVGIGLQDLNRTKTKGFLNTAEQQKNWHRSMGYRLVKNNPSKTKVKDARGLAPLISLAVGKVISSTFLENKWVHCNGDVDLNAFMNVSGHTGASFAGSTGTARIEVGVANVFLDRYLLTLFGQASGQLVAHEKGFQSLFESTLGLDIFEVMSLGYRQRFYEGKLINYQSHNTVGENDTGRIGEFFFQLNFNID